METGIAEAAAQALRFEIDGDVSQVGGNRDLRASQQFVLPLLRSGMVDFEDSQIRPGISVGKVSRPAPRTTN